MCFFWKDFFISWTFWRPGGKKATQLQLKANTKKNQNNSLQVAPSVSTEESKHSAFWAAQNLGWEHSAFGVGASEGFLDWGEGEGYGEFNHLLKQYTNFWKPGDSIRAIFFIPYISWKLLKLWRGHVFTIPKKVTSRIARYWIFGHVTLLVCVLINSPLQTWLFLQITSEWSILNLRRPHQRRRCGRAGVSSCVFTSWWRRHESKGPTPPQCHLPQEIGSFKGLLTIMIPWYGLMNALFLGGALGGAPLDSHECIVFLP